MDPLWAIHDPDRFCLTARNRPRCREMAGSRQGPRSRQDCGSPGAGCAMTEPASQQSQPALSVEGIAVHFRGVVAISDMSFTVTGGEVVGLIGPNGAGKTT